MITKITAIRFPERHIPDKTFQIVTFLINDVKIDGGRIRREGFLSFDALGIWMDVVGVKKTHHIHTLGSHNFNGIYGAICATDV
jgi:hypothetical protein